MHFYNWGNYVDCSQDEKRNDYYNHGCCQEMLCKCGAVSIAHGLGSHGQLKQSTGMLTAENGDPTCQANEERSQLSTISTH